MKTEIIYIYDPMCGWCYGFSPVIEKLNEKYKDDFDWSIYSGGMAIGENAFEISRVSEYISGALGSVEKTSGIVFGEKFKNEMLKSDYFYSSLKPSIALTVFKELDNQNSIKFASDIQRAFFYNAESLNELNTYLQIIKKYNLSAEEFSHKFLDPIYEAKTYNQEFYTSQSFNVSGFPTVIAKTENKNIILSRGFQTFEKLSANIERLITISV